MKIFYITLSAFLFLCTKIDAQNAEYTITKYGAVANAKTPCTQAFQATVDDCAKNGGGKIIVPAGVFVIGTVHLKSNINLYLQAGAIVQGSSNINDYEIFIPEKQFLPIHKGMLFTEDAENITISGEGQIDGNSIAFFDSTKAKKIEWGGTQYTRQKNNFRKVVSGIGDGPIVPKERPYQMFVFSNCKRVTVKDIFVTNAPFWCMHFADCDAVKVDGIRLWNNLLAPNSDGIDLTSCTNASISNCDIRTGDDAIAIVGYNHHFEIPGFNYRRHISENIIVSNCNLQSSSSAIRIGFLDQNTVRNIQVNNCNITNSTRGIGIFLRDEGSLENISFSNMYIETKLRTGDWWGNGEPIHISAVRGKEKVVLGKIKNVQFSHIICKGENGMLIYGSEESRIDGINFDNIIFELTNSKLNDVAGGNIDLRGCLGDSTQLFARDIPALLIKYANHIFINNFKLLWSNTSYDFFTHGIEASYFDQLKIKSFEGTASPINTKAHKIFVAHGKGFESDGNTDVVQKEME